MIRGFVLCLMGMAGPVAAQECGWIGGFINGVGVPDFDACEGTVCQWRFDYRNASAAGLYDMFSQQLEKCLGPQIITDKGVNHPDSYDLRQYQAKDGMIFVSIKDKAALQQTIVFLRVEPTLGD
ncbi:MAG: hypothetical protein AAFW87_06570 [Pseudomonadota bacterium]